MAILLIGEWETPVSKIPAQSIGDFHIVKRVIEGESLDMAGAGGYDDCFFAFPITLTILRQGERDATDTESVWMSDSPMEYYMGWDLVAKTRPGRVLIGGLGLGLLVHLLSLRRDISEIVVVELSPEVIELTAPYLPSIPKVEVIQGDFLMEIQKLSSRLGEDYFQTVIADIWKGGDEESKEMATDCRYMMEDNFHSARHLFWAYQHEFEDADAEMGISYYLHQKEKGKGGRDEKGQF